MSKEEMLWMVLATTGLRMHEVSQIHYEKGVGLSHPLINQTWTQMKKEEEK